jgi:bifunctional non-homologous end joining protein LigD
MPLARYNAKRDFAKTPEPAGQDDGAGKSAEQRSFVIQKHWASHLHYDFRLELDGVLLSWAVPKGPSFDPKVKRMAIHVEDHPVSYAGFEGDIPAKQYGAGSVIVWDRGTWEPIGDPRAGLASGKLVFALHGEKLAGRWELVRIAKPGERQEAWLLFKKKDAWAQPADAFDVVTALPDSVIARPLGAADDRAGGKKDGPPAGAMRAKLPETLAPQLATLAKAAPTGGDWIVEAKFDGYRILARIEGGKARLFTRNGNDWTHKLGPIAAAAESLGIDDSWLDGEIVVATPAGGQDFNALQNAMDHGKNDRISYFLFDAPFLVGYDLRRSSLEARRAALKNVVDRSPHDRIRFSDRFDAPPEDVLKAACAMKLEGIILKRRDATYASARNDDWLKLKCTLRQEFVVGGYTDRANSTKEIGNLFLGVYDDGKLRYAGAVGTGWSLATARELKEKLAVLEVAQSPFEAGSTKHGRWTRRAAGTEHWVRPELVAEAAFAEWTPEGHLRHASFQGLRTDKPARAIVREDAVAPPEEKAARKADATAVASKTRKASAAASKTAVESSSRSTAAREVSSDREVDGIRVSSPERVIDPQSGATKLDLVRYYERVADFILPHLRGRPVSLVRGPDGVGGELFFQKHLDAKIAGVKQLDASLWPGHGALMVIDTKEALLSAAQMNTIEFHTWNATAPVLDAPDRIVFDLDPGEGVTWQQIREAALLTHAMLDELGLVSFLKTSGGKGLHVVVPIEPKLDWVTVKGFSQAVVRHLAKTIPDRFVAKSGGSNRVGKIFVDYLRNGLGATTAVAFSARSRPGLGVSMPIAWEQLDRIESGAQWTIATACAAWSSLKRDPWADASSMRQTLADAIERLA